MHNFTLLFDCFKNIDIGFHLNSFQNTFNIYIVMKIENCYQGILYSNEL